MNLREQGAERLAKSVMDAYATGALMGYARECRELAARPADLSTSQTHPMAVSDTAWLKDTGRRLALSNLEKERADV
jgi:hypothetical protein